MVNIFDQFDEQESSIVPNIFDQFDEDREEPTEVETSIKSNALPEAGTYSQDDMVDDDQMYTIIENYMVDRYGAQKVEDETRSDVVDMFLNNRRGVSAGNTVRGLKEIDYVNDIQSNSAKLARAGAAYQLYENMAGLYSKETTLGEKLEGTGDYIRTILLDPVNLVGGLIGKAAGGGALRLASSSAKKQALKMAAKQSGKEGAEKAVKLQFTKAAAKATNANKARIAEYTAEVLGTKGLKRLATKNAMVEIGTTTGIDAVVNAGMETLYQQGLLKTGVRDEFSWGAVGIAAVGSIVMGGVQAGVVLKRGASGIQAPTTALPEPDASGFMSDISKAIAKYTEQTVVKKTDSWNIKVAKGKELDLKDLKSDFWFTLLLGHENKETGEVFLKGMGQLAAERGFVWGKRFEDDKFTDWMGDVIKQSSKKEVRNLLNEIQKATGTKIKGITKITPENLGNIMASSMSEAGKNLNAVSQAAKMLGKSTDDVEIKHLIEAAMDMGFLSRNFKDAEKITDSATLGFIKSFQNKNVRLLVSNPSTSALNVVGWGANVALNTVSDVALASIHASRGAMLRVAKAKDAGKSDFDAAKLLYESTKMRIKLLLDPDMTHAAYQSALQRNSQALQNLNSVLPGGVTKSTKLITDSKFSPETKLLELKADDFIDTIQTMTLVNAQDSFTKSQEFIFQMDKVLRSATDRGFTDFYNWEGATKFMASKEYRQLEAVAVDRTLEAVFSKSYKAPNAMGQIAGMIEDARNIPGIGLLVPFGRFWNSTVAFAGKNAPGINLGLKAIGKYKDTSVEEMFARTAVVGGLLYSMSLDETENRKRGLGLYDETDPFTGEIINQQYDFPLSMFKAMSRLISYYTDDEEGGPPTELWSRISKDFLIESQFRGISKAQRDLVDAAYYMSDPENRDLWKAAGIVIKTTAVQPIQAGTRFLEPLNVAAGVIRGEEAVPMDRYQGNQLINNTTRYIDNIVALVTGGKSIQEPQKTAAAGEVDVDSAKVLGVRTFRYTETEKVLNILGLDAYPLNQATSDRKLVPKAVNEYHGLFHDILEAKATAIMSNRKDFVKLPLETQRRRWRELTNTAGKEAKSILATRRVVSDEDDYTVDLLINLTESNSTKKLEKAVRELGYEKEFQELTRAELVVLDSYLDARDYIQNLKLPGSVRRID
tara:strand:- start:40 stop:3534 length:3495 start_codon:yes stop_codon:yes gene_type:complete